MLKCGIELSRLAEINSALAGRSGEEINADQVLQLRAERQALANKVADEYAQEPVMVFDWEKAFNIISQEVKDHGEGVTFSAGLSKDWYRTWGYIFSYGESYYNYTRLVSKWYKPTLVQHFDDGSSCAWECWRYSSELPKGVKYQQANQWGGWLNVKSGADLVARVKGE